MKEKLTRNIGLKVLSIILAAMLWLVITNVDDPVTTKYFDNVAVTPLNDDEITKNGEKVYEIIEGETIDFSVAARRSIADNLSASDFRVTADFSKLSDVNATTINIYSPRYGDQVTVTEGLYQVMKINVEDLVEKQFKVNVVQKGEPAEGYYVASKKAAGAATLIRVAGPKSKIEQIAEVIVEVDVTNLSVPFNTYEEPVAKDKEGKEIDASNLKFSTKSIPVSIEMYRTKMINLLIETKGKPEDGYVMTAIDYEPKEIEIAGPDEALNAIDTLTINENIDGAVKNIEKEINIQEYLKDGLILTGENQTVAVNVTIEKVQTKELQIRSSDIDIRNKPSGLQAVIRTIGPITVKVEGPAKVIKDITTRNLKPYIDLSNYRGGTYDVAVQTTVPENAIVSNAPSVSVYLTE
jgi:YbbR domain-containing protein